MIGWIGKVKLHGDWTRSGRGIVAKREVLRLGYELIDLYDAIGSTEIKEA